MRRPGHELQEMWGRPQRRCARRPTESDASLGPLGPAARRREARLAGSEAAVGVPKGGASTVPHLIEYGP